MSTNLHLKASVEARLQLKQVQQKKTIVEYFDLWQTPTKVTERILDSNDPFSAYVDWVKDENFQETETMYKVENVVDGFVFYNWVFEEELKRDFSGHTILKTSEAKTAEAEHIEMLENWLKEHDEWNIEWYAL